MLLSLAVLLTSVFVGPDSVECMKSLAVDEASVEELIDEGTLEVLAFVLLNVLMRSPGNSSIVLSM